MEPPIGLNDLMDSDRFKQADIDKQLTAIDRWYDDRIEGEEERSKKSYQFNRSMLKGMHEMDWMEKNETPELAKYASEMKGAYVDLTVKSRDPISDTNTKADRAKSIIDFSERQKAAQGELFKNSNRRSLVMSRAGDMVTEEQEEAAGITEPKAYAADSKKIEQLSMDLEWNENLTPEERASRVQQLEMLTRGGSPRKPKIRESLIQAGYSEDEIQNGVADSRRLGGTAPDRASQHFDVLSNGDIVFSPEGLLFPEDTRKGIESSALPAGAKRRALKRLDAESESYVQNLYQEMSKSETIKSRLDQAKASAGGNARTAIQSVYETGEASPYLTKAEIGLRAGTNDVLNLAPTIVSGLTFGGLWDGTRQDLANQSAGLNAAGGVLTQGGVAGGASAMGMEFTQGLAAAVPQIAMQLGAAKGIMGLSAASGASAATASNIGFATSVGLSGAQSATSSYNEALSKGMGRGEALYAGMLAGTVAALVAAGFGKSGVESMFATPAAKAGLKEYFGSIMVNAGEEGLEEFTDEFINGLIASANYGENRTTEKIVGDALMAASIGIAMGGGMRTMQGRGADTPAPPPEALRPDVSPVPEFAYDFDSETIEPAAEAPPEGKRTSIIPPITGEAPPPAPKTGPVNKDRIIEKDGKFSVADEEFDDEFETREEAEKFARTRHFENYKRNIASQFGDVNSPEVKVAIEAARRLGDGLARAGVNPDKEFFANIKSQEQVDAAIADMKAKDEARLAARKEEGGKMTEESNAAREEGDARPASEPDRQAIANQPEALFRNLINTAGQQERSGGIASDIGDSVEAIQARVDELRGRTALNEDEQTELENNEQLLSNAILEESDATRSSGDPAVTRADIAPDQTRENGAGLDGAFEKARIDGLRKKQAGVQKKYDKLKDKESPAALKLEEELTDLEAEIQTPAAPRSPVPVQPSASPTAETDTSTQQRAQGISKGITDLLARADLNRSADARADLSSKVKGARTRTSQQKPKWNTKANLLQFFDRKGGYKKVIEDLRATSDLDEAALNRLDELGKEMMGVVNEWVDARPGPTRDGSLNQPDANQSGSRGSIKRLDTLRGVVGANKVLISAFGSGDPTTLIHETFHALQLLTGADGKPLLDIALGPELDKFNKWTTRDGAVAPNSTEALERAAVGLEQYLLTGKSPAPQLDSMFRRLAALFRSVYAGVRNVIMSVPENLGGQHDLNEDAIRAYDRLFGAIKPDGSVTPGVNPTEAGKQPEPGILAGIQGDSRFAMEGGSIQIPKADGTPQKGFKGKNQAMGFRKKAAKRLGIPEGAMKLEKDGDGRYFVTTHPVANPRLFGNSATGNTAEASTLNQGRNYGTPDRLWSNGEYSIGVDPDKKPYAMGWSTHRLQLKRGDEIVGKLDLYENPVNKGWYEVAFSEIEPAHRGKKLGIELYRQALGSLPPGALGISSDLELRTNEKQIPAIYKKFNGYEENGFAFMPRQDIAPTKVPDLSRLSQGLASAAGSVARVDGMREGLTDAAQVRVEFQPRGRQQVLNALLDEAADLNQTLYQFGGEAANVPQFMRDSLDTAKSMANTGKSSVEIRALTGWFPGKYDGKMRWEIPDGKATLKTDFGKATNVSGLLNHPDLFAAYPTISDFPVEFRGFEAGITKDGKRLILPSAIRSFSENNSAILKGILHEIQHIIQDYEGFARGGNTQEIYTKEIREINKNKATLEAERDSAKSRYESNRSEENLKAWSKAIDAVWEVMGERPAKRPREDELDYYKRIAGEIESRDVEARSKLSPEQLAATEPYSSENIAPDDAVILFQGSGKYSVHEIGEPVTTGETGLQSDGSYNAPFMRGQLREAIPWQEFASAAQRSGIENFIYNEDTGDVSLYQLEAPSTDSEYLAAVEAGDMDAAQRMVDAAARAAGFPIGPVFHGTDAKFESFSKSRTRGQMGFHVGTESQAGFFSETPIKLFIRAENPLRLEDSGSWYGEEARRLVSEALGKRIIQDSDSALAREIRNAGYDSVVYKNTKEWDDEVEPEPMDSYILFEPNQIKSADPITRDASGNVIPLSKRFNQESPSILYQAQRLTSEINADRKILGDLNPEVRKVRVHQPETGSLDASRNALGEGAADLSRAQVAALTESRRWVHAMNPGHGNDPLVKDAYRALDEELGVVIEPDPDIIRNERQIRDISAFLKNPLAKWALASRLRGQRASGGQSVPGLLPIALATTGDARNDLALEQLAAKLRSSSRADYVLMGSAAGANDLVSRSMEPNDDARLDEIALARTERFSREMDKDITLGQVDLPILRPHAEEKRVSAMPTGLAAFWNKPIAKLLGGTTYSPWRQVANALEGSPLHKVVAAWWRYRDLSIRASRKASREMFHKHGKPFEIDPVTGNIMNFTGPVSAAVSQNYIDVFEAEMETPGSYPLSPAQQAWVADARGLIQDMVKQSLANGIPMAMFTDSNGAIDYSKIASNFYFPRRVIGSIDTATDTTKSDRTGKNKSTGGGPRSARGFDKSRKYSTAMEGVNDGITYDPDPLSALEGFLRDAYSKIGDFRTINDPDLGGNNNLASVKRGTRVVKFGEIQAVFDEVTANDLESWTTKKLEEWPMLKSMKNGLGIVRALKLGVDFSAPLIQGVIIHTTRPVRALKADIAAIREFLSDGGSRKHFLQRNASIKEMVESGSAFGAALDYQEVAMEVGGQIRAKSSRLGKVYDFTMGRFNRFHSTFMDAAAIEFWEANRRHALDPATGQLDPQKARELALQCDRLVGREAISAYGFSKNGINMMQVIGTAPSMYVAYGNILGSLFSKNPTERKVAWGEMSRFVTGGTLVFIGTALAAGMEWPEIKERLKPWNSKFLTVQAKSPGADDLFEFGMGGFFRSVTRMTGQLAMLGFDGRDNTLSEVLGPLQSFAGNRVSPGVSLAISLKTGVDHFGTSKDTARLLIEGIIPVALTDSAVRAVDWARKTSPAQAKIPFFDVSIAEMFGVDGQFMLKEEAEFFDSTAFNLLTEMTGLSSYPVSKRQQWYQESEGHAKTLFGKEYKDLAPMERIIVVEMNTALKGAPPSMSGFDLDDFLRVKSARVAEYIDNPTKLALADLGLLDKGVAGPQAYKTTDNVAVPMTKEEQGKMERSFGVNLNELVGPLAGLKDMLPREEYEKVIRDSIKVAEDMAMMQAGWPQ